MTKREFLNAVISANVNADLTAYAQDELSKLDATNAKRRESDKPTKAKLEAEAARNSIIAYVMEMDGAQDAETIANGSGTTEGQVPSALRTLVSEGKVEKSIVKVDSKHRKTVYKYIG